MSGRAVGLLLGFAADRLLGDPQRFHPVAGFGKLSHRLEQKLYADSKARGAGFTSLMVAGAVGFGLIVDRLARQRTATTAVATFIVLGGRSLATEAEAVAARLESGDLGAARRQVQRLVGRDTDHLDATQVARAAVESIAENTSDAVVAPLLAGAFFGTPGLLGYRAINTLDAMIGHRSERYTNFGWAAARLDDVANLPGSRLTASLTVLWAGITRPRSARDGWTAWRRDAARHPSPNAGVVEAAFAGVLGVQLGGPNQYYGVRVENRPVMGDGGRAVEPRDIARALSIARAVGAAASVVAAAVGYSTRIRPATTR